jgi:sugar/nucleoside kinase (ribokinase family)
MRTVGGGAVITGTAAARLGLRTEVVSALSPAASRALEAQRVAVRDLRRAGEAHAVTVAMSTASDRAFVTFGGVNDVLEPRLLAAAGRLRARHAHFALFPADCRRWAAAAERLRRRGTTTSVDFGWDDRLRRHPGFRRLLAAVDYVFLNRQEAVLYSGLRRLEQAFAYWRRHARNAVVKLGARGSRWVSRELDLALEPPRVRAIDTTGAGDAFNGGFLYGLLRGHSPERCLEIGNLVGALSTRAAGGIASLPAADELT